MSKKSLISTKPTMGVKEAAQFVGVSPVTIRRWAYAGHLVGMKIGLRGDWRFSEQNLLKLSKHTPQTKTGEYSTRLSTSLEQGNPQSFRLSGKFFRQLVDSIEYYAVVTTDKEGTMSSWNSGASRILGYSEQEIIGKNSSIFFTPEARKNKKPEQEFAIALKKGRATNERWHLRKDKTRFWGSGLVFPLKDETRKIRGFTHIFRDLTSLRQAEETLQKSEYKLDAEVKIMNELYASSVRLHTAKDLKSAMNGILTSTVRLLQADFGNIQLYDKEQKVLKLVVLHKFDHEFSTRFQTVAIDDNTACGRAIRSGKRVIIEDIEQDAAYAPYRKAAVAAGYRSVQSTPLYDLKKNLLGVLSTHWKKTHAPSQRELKTLDLYARQATSFIIRALAEDALRESEKRFRVMANNIQNLAWMTRSDGWAFWYNQRWYDYTGMTLDEMKGWGWKKVHHPEHIDRVVAFITEAWQKPEAWELTFPLKGKDGQYRSFLTRAEPLLDKNGKIERWIVTNTDVEDIHKKQEVEQRLELLTEQRNALVKLNKTKDEFIALASHQLRTPATAVKQYISLLMGEFGGPHSADQIQYLQIAYDSNERQLTIINDLLKTAQIDSSKYQLNKQSQNIISIIKETIADMQSICDLRNQIILCESSKKNLTVIVDAVEIKIVLINLLENASKYSYPGTEIKVVVKSEEKYALISFIDQGVGIHEDNQKRIFDKFTRVDNELSDTVNGSGLGLYWVKQIAHMHKGSITLTSAPKKGSNFTLRLPL